mgnify:CR=1 FL=1
MKVNNTVKGVKIEITKAKEIAKAYNHNTIKSKTNTSPKRPFMPDDKGSAVKPKGKGADQFRTSIVKGIDLLLKDDGDDDI